MSTVIETDSYEAITMPYYTDHILAERAKSAVWDFKHLGYVLNPQPKRIDVVESFLTAFIARDAEKNGLPFSLFRLEERRTVFSDWKTGAEHSIRYEDLSRFQKARVLTILAEAVPAPTWGKKK